MGKKKYSVGTLCLKIYCFCRKKLMLRNKFSAALRNEKKYFDSEKKQFIYFVQKHCQITIIYHFLIQDQRDTFDTVCAQVLKMAYVEIVDYIFQWDLCNRWKNVYSFLIGLGLCVSRR